MMEMEEYKRLKERRKRNVTSYVTQRIVKMNLGNLSEKNQSEKGCIAHGVDQKIMLRKLDN